MSLLKASLVLAAMILLGAEARASGALFTSDDAPAAPVAATMSPLRRPPLAVPSQGQGTLPAWPMRSR